VLVVSIFCNKEGGIHCHILCQNNSQVSYHLLWISCRFVKYGGEFCRLLTYAYDLRAEWDVTCVYRT
jgi:hypothetical protein